MSAMDRDVVVVRDWPVSDRLVSGLSVSGHSRSLSSFLKGKRGIIGAYLRDGFLLRHVWAPDGGRVGCLRYYEAHFFAEGERYRI